MNKTDTRNRPAALAGFLVLTFLAPLAGAGSMPGEWYANLAKPDWTPPGWLFGPAWTILYILMAVAAWMVWQRVGWTRPLWLWLAQLALNAAWSPIFFGAKQPGWAFAEIIALWLAIAATIATFMKVNRRAAWLLIPYLAWVSFATVLNCAIWRLQLD